ncbi:MAG: phosphoribosylamine--glycine ligase, partial [Beijerinckiaceae bacterium]
MNVLLIGSGGREHALAWKLALSPMLGKLFVAPGNPGTATCGENVVLDVSDHAAVAGFCRLLSIDLVVIGPEAPLVAGLADDLRAAGLRVFGHGRAAARLEGSKAFTKEICDAAGIPTARYATFNTATAAKAHVRKDGAPIVIKYDGLAAGKGVTVAMTVEEAEAAIDVLYAGEPAATVVIEECMMGEEVSFFALVHGEQCLPLAAAQDHKRVGDGDTGPNTGGMGAYSPVAAFTDALRDKVMETIICPTAREMVRRGAPCSGVLFAGLMLTAEGPKLIEYNVRFGDPECQVLMLRLDDDLLALLLAAAEGRLEGAGARFRDVAALVVVMAAEGYPGEPVRGTVIRKVAEAEALPGVAVFHAGTKAAEGRLLANGGRVLGITAEGASVAEAKARAYAGVDLIDWPDGFCRRDIGWRAV